MRPELRRLENRWKFDASEEPRHNRFLRWRQLPLFCHPIEGKPTTITSRSKRSADGGRGRFFIGPFLGHPRRR
jgi:hypothetical protein